MRRKCFLLGAATAVIGKSACFGDFVAEQIIHPRTGQQTVFWGDASKGKDAYVVSYDEGSRKLYLEKIEKNKPSAKNKTEGASNRSKDVTK